MKIKHFQGYGIVNAKRVSKKETTNVFTGETTVELKILVWGNHEWGLELRHFDTYDLHKWLVSKFAKEFANYRDIDDYKTHVYYDKVNGVDTEHCLYTIYINKN